MYTYCFVAACKYFGSSATIFYIWHFYISLRRPLEMPSLRTCYFEIIYIRPRRQMEMPRPPKLFVFTKIQINKNILIRPRPRPSFEL